MVHGPSLCSWSSQNNVRSSRRGREQTRAKISESGRVAKIKRSDLRTGDNPCNETRVSLSLFDWPMNRSKCTTLQLEGGNRVRVYAFGEAGIVNG